MQGSFTPRFGGKAGKKVNWKLKARSDAQTRRRAHGLRDFECPYNHLSLAIQSCECHDWTKALGEEKAIERVLALGVGDFAAKPWLLRFVQFRNFGLLHYGVGGFFAEHVDRFVRYQKWR